MKRILVLVGGSGSGKSTIATELEKQGFHRLVTTTTRPMREGEVNHISYHFVSEEEFWKLNRVEENQYVGNWYGLSKDEVEEKMKIYEQLIIVMDINGAKAMKRIYGNIVQVVFITISPKIMEERLRQRGSSEEQVRARLENAYKYEEFTKPAAADFEVVNIDLETTLHQIMEFTQYEKLS